MQEEESFEIHRFPQRDKKNYCVSETKQDVMINKIHLENNNILETKNMA